MPTHIERSALLPHSAEKLFDLINDVNQYPQYMAGCSKAEVIMSNETHMQARLNLSKGGLHYSFTTSNRLQRPNSITMTLVDGPFDSLTGEWTFLALASDACKVSLNLTFELSRSGINKAAGKLLESASNDLVQSLCKRAHQVYGS